MPLPQLRSSVFSNMFHPAVKAGKNATRFKYETWPSPLSASCIITTRFILLIIIPQNSILEQATASVQSQLSLICNILIPPTYLTMKTFTLLALAATLASMASASPLLAVRNGASRNVPKDCGSSCGTGSGGCSGYWPEVESSHYSSCCYSAYSYSNKGGSCGSKGGSCGSKGCSCGSKEGSCKDDSKDTFKDDCKDDSKDDCKDEPKDDCKDEPKDDCKDEPKDDCKDHSKDDCKDDSKDDCKDHSKDDCKYDCKHDCEEECCEEKEGFCDETKSFNT